MKLCPKCQLEYREEGRTHCLVDGTPLEDVADPRIGRLLAGRYAIEESIGIGGMATVYRGQDVGTGRPVAVKIMHDVLSSEPQLRERFRREARNSALLTHENVAETLDAGQTDDGRPFLVMELLEGETLREMIKRGAMPPDFVVMLGAQIAKGLARAHDLGVIHRDLKPENIFVVRQGERVLAKLVDFGIARSRDELPLTVAGAILGSPPYLAPERVRGKSTEASSDLYALGIVLFEMVTGKLPFESETMQGFLFHHLETEPPLPSASNPSCPPELDSLVLRLLAKNPRERPVDAHQVVRELEALHTSLVARIAPRGSLQPDPTPIRTRPRGSAVSMGLDRWTRRAIVMTEMAQRVYRGRSVPPPIAAALEVLHDGVVQLDGLNRSRSEQQKKVDQVGVRTKETREQLGRAVHSLGRDLSDARQALEALRAELARRELEVSDLEYQLRVLRGNLAHKEGAAEDERAEAESALASTGADIERVRREMGEAARTIAETLRNLPGGSALLQDLD